MKEKSKNCLSRLENRLVSIGIFLGVIFWLIESMMHVYVFHPFDFIYSVFFPGMHEAWMRSIIVAMFISFGIFTQWLINARKQAQTALKLANAELTQIFETSADGMCVIDRNYNMLRANDTFCLMAGIEKEDITGKKCHEVFSGPLCHTDLCPLTRIQKGEWRVECDSDKTGASGRKIPCIVTATPFWEPDGHLIGIVEDIKDITERKQAEEDLKQSRKMLRELTSYLESAREKERTLIAREIHDELGQSLTALKMELHWCIQRIPKNDKVLEEKAAALTRLVDDNVHLLQRISSELRPGLLDDIGLSAAIEWQTGQFQERTGIECDIICEPFEIVLDTTVSTVIYRIFQEAITNIARHAKATRTEIILKKGPDDIELTVSDNGRGITELEISDHRSFGLMGIRERVFSLGGTVEITGIENEGTTVKIDIPLFIDGGSTSDKDSGRR